MAIIVDKVTFQEFTGHTPDYEGNDQYLIINRTNLEEYEAFKAQGIPKKFWKIVDGVLVVMSQEEQDALIAAELLAYKKAKILELVDSCNVYIQSKYTLENQQTISYLMDMAERENKPNRFNYYNQVGIWATTILGYYYMIADQIFAVTTVADVNLLMAGVNFSQFDAADPKITIRNGFALDP